MLKLLNGFGEGVEGRGRSGGRSEDVRREEVEAEREVGGGEDGEGFDEDVCDCFVFGEVGVELVAGRSAKFSSWLEIEMREARESQNGYKFGFSALVKGVR